MRTATLLLAAVGVPLLAAQEPQAPRLGGLDKDYYSAVRTTTDQVMVVMGQSIKQTQDQTFYFRWTELAPDRDGRPRYRQRFEGVKMSVEMSGNKVTYDSTKPGQGGDGPLADFFKALVGTELVVTIDRDGDVAAVEGGDELVEKLTRANPQLKPLLETILSDDALKSMGHPAGGIRVPPDVKVGDKWNSKHRINLGPIGSYLTRYSYTAAGPDRKAPNLLAIEVEPEITYRPPAKGKGGGLPFTVKNGKLKSGADSAGIAWYDTKTKRLVRSELNVHLEGTLTITIGGMDTDVKLEQDQKTVVQFAAKSLLP